MAAGDKGYMFNPLLRHGFQKRQGGSGGGTDPSDLDKKVDKYQGGSKSGMVLYVDPNGFVSLRNVREITVAERNKLAGLPSEIPSYGIDAVEVESGYLKTYQLYALVGGKKTYLPDKINIPKDLHIKSVDVVTVSDTNPMQGYANGKYLKYVFVTDTGDVEQMINVNDLFSYALEPGDHVRIENDVVSAHSFVPQYDSVSKVLPGEDQFQYTGDTTEDGKWVKDFFYRKKQIEQPIYNPTLHHFDIGTDYIDVLQDGYQLPKGRYYEVSEPLPSEAEAGKTFWTLTPYVNNGNDLHYQSAQAGVLKIGDKVWTYGDYSQDTKFYRIVEIGYTNYGYVRTLKLSNGETIYTSKSNGVNPFRRLLVSENGDKMYYVASSGSGYRAGDISDGYIGVPRENTDPDRSRACLYHDGLGWVPGSAVKGKLTEAVDVTVNYVSFAGVYDWVQIDVQPTADFSAIDSRLDDLEADSHKQNTDTALATNKLVVESNKISATLPIVSSGDIQGTDTTTNTTHLLSKKLNSDMLRMYSSWSAMESDKSNIPEGAWCAITEY